LQNDNSADENIEIRLPNVDYPLIEDGNK